MLSTILLGNVRGDLQGNCHTAAMIQRLFRAFPARAAPKQAREHKED